MKIATILTATSLVVLFVTPAASLAHRLTEKYIPIGAYESWDRGIVRGTVASVDRDAKRVTVQQSNGSVTVTVTGDTRIWLDRSSVPATTLDGSFEELQPGRTVECSPGEGNGAAWIKVRVSQ